MTVRSGRPAKRNTAWRRAVSGVATSDALAAGLLIVSHQRRRPARHTPSLNPATIGLNPLGPGQVPDPNAAPSISIPLG